uniref:Lipase n=1 Tax=Heliothis virescens TaxID=7102 RepID=A0A2A4K660_HELVI
MLHGGLYVVLATCVALVAARESPHADYVRELFQSIEWRHSDNVFEDGLLDVPDLIRKYRYPVEVHHVTTKDGYILEMHRIPHGRDANNDPNKKRPVVFLMHGMVSSSADLVIMGPGSALGYILAEEGFDVWMGNARGNYYSRRHVTLNPDVGTAFWKFSWDEIGNIDLPTMIDYALEVSGEERLHYIGHSQGTTSFFVLGSLQPAYNAKFISMHALAPSAYFEHIGSPYLKLVARYINHIERLVYLVGIAEFFPNSEALTWAGQNLCHDEAVFQPMCSNIVFLIGGWNEDQHNATMMPAILGHSPAGAAARQFVHYGQGIASNEFRRYDYGNALANLRAYGSTRPPNYDLSKITAPVFLHYSASDPVAHVDDVDRLYRELGNPKGKLLIPMSTFSHLDFIYAIDAKELLYDRVIDIMKTMDDNYFNDHV